MHASLQADSLNFGDNLRRPNSADDYRYARNRTLSSHSNLPGVGRPVRNIYHASAGSLSLLDGRRLARFYCFLQSLVIQRPNT